MKENLKNYPIDLNADLGEGGLYDEALLHIVTSANIACGGHTGNLDTMTIAVESALRNGVKIGAHPSYPDPANFGRSPMALSDKALHESISNQINALKVVCERLGAKMFHVKPHGAFYNNVAKNEAMGLVLIDVIKQVDPKLRLMILAGSPLVEQAKLAGLNVIQEAFADRAYLNDGSLAPRSREGAVIHDKQIALAQVKQFIQQKPITSLDGQPLKINADTICLHGDNEQALEFAKSIYQLIQTK
ncbi:5-oxoprolinase subunit PxpA [Shewanella sp. D64]|uniref:5-oxoprolinase subunit PxpA n=1 Tax=unclassified Shewanella TaxID=196818 RepID=UPI0022BA3D9A|nr:MULTISPECIES: 5-oxoprolinase subunit PxpA [unclassified Shewanella]MEC4727158.1 5-oxoprolinase subunit PxpA [Shewanella sp. D64]MEC4739225.1 5-oxoprolinase subunit PxpA [Shewanella sp. E94]WBJ95565.1 5-oxoprolinase subunit PxpA [Shewanella sp. MTB7]